MPDFTEKELKVFQKQFDSFDTDKSGSITADELTQVLRNLNENADPARVKKLISEVDADNSGTIEFSEFLTIIKGIRSGASGGDLTKVYHKQATVVALQGATAQSSHSYSEEELEGFVGFMNSTLGSDEDLKKFKKVPIQSAQDLFKNCSDGILLTKLINAMVPDTIDERAIAFPPKLNTFSTSENQVIVIESAKSIGCNVVNIRPADLTSGTPHLILGLVWQIIRIGLFSQITLANHPELYRLLEPGETIEQLLALPVDQILLRWVNYHLKNAGSNRRIANFTGDIKDSEAYTILMSQIAPKLCDRSPLKEKDPLERAEKMLQNADKLECRKFVSPKDVVNGNQKLNLAFVANLFNNHPGLAPLEDTSVVEDVIEETREEKTFRNWMNSLGVDPFVSNLYEDLRDGLILLQLFEKVQPGILNQKRVNWQPKINMQKIENCNYAVELGKFLGFSLVGIGGKDIYDGNRTLTLSVVWQLMRYHSVSLLRSLGESVSDADILKWANKKVSSGGFKMKIASFNDKAGMSDSVFLAHLLEAVRPGCLDLNLVKKTSQPKELFNNAKYVITIARKLGATVFALPDDIVEAAPKMVMLLIAGIWSAAQASGEDSTKTPKKDKEGGGSGSGSKSPRGEGKSKKPKEGGSGHSSKSPSRSSGSKRSKSPSGSGKAKSPKPKE